MSEAAAIASAWLLEEGARLRFLDDVFAGVCRILHEAGLPLDRSTLHIRALHPQFRAVRFRWHPGDERAELLRVGEIALHSPAYLNSPVRALFEGAEGLRQRLDMPLPADAATIYGDLQEQGFSDYVALPLVFSNGQRIASSWATTRPGGWRTEELLELDAVRPLLAMAAEIRIARRVARNIAETYLGRRAGDRVLDGQIIRGDLDTIDAVIAYLDMREFTSFSERAESERVLARLNGFFDAFGGAIEAADGEILKFIGDGILAIFPVSDGDARSEGGEVAATRAFDAALEGAAALERFNEELQAEGDERIRFGLALHQGPVAFGNIGTAGRLDFTVVGPAVNLASRLQGLTKGLGEPIVMSDVVAKASGRPVREIGRHGVRSVPRAMTLFAPATKAEP